MSGQNTIKLFISRHSHMAYVLRNSASSPIKKELWEGLTFSLRGNLFSPGRVRQVWIIQTWTPGKGGNHSVRRPHSQDHFAPSSPSPRKPYLLRPSFARSLCSPLLPASLPGGEDDVFTWIRLHWASWALYPRRLGQKALIWYSTLLWPFPKEYFTHPDPKLWLMGRKRTR